MEELRDHTASFIKLILHSKGCVTVSIAYWNILRYHIEMFKIGPVYSFGFNQKKSQDLTKSEVSVQSAMTDEGYFRSKPDGCLPISSLNQGLCPHSFCVLWFF